MGHSYTNLLYHLVWATKLRRPWLDKEVRPALFACLGGLAKEEGGIPLCINGVEDHVHLLVKLRQDKAVSDVLRAVKAGSSQWFHKTFERPEFCWQTGYGAFTVSPSQVPRVRTYIGNQEEHHKNWSLPDEVRTLLRLHEIDVPEELTWD